jgi:predicted helicase
LFFHLQTAHAEPDPQADPIRMDDQQYIVRLIGQVITVSLETQKIVKDLPEVTVP